MIRRTHFLTIAIFFICSLNAYGQNPSECWYSEHMQMELCKRQYVILNSMDEKGHELEVIHSLDSKGKIVVSESGLNLRTIEKEDILYLPTYNEGLLWTGYRIILHVGQKRAGSGIYKKKSFKIKDGDEVSAIKKCQGQGYACWKGSKLRRNFSLRIAARCVSVGLSPLSSYCREANYVDTIWGVKVNDRKLRQFHKDHPNTCENMNVLKQFRNFGPKLEVAFKDLGCGL